MTHKLKTEMFSQRIEYSGGVFFWPLTPLFGFVSFHLNPIVNYHVYCMALLHSQTRRHMIYIYIYIYIFFFFFLQTLERKKLCRPIISPLMQWLTRFPVNLKFGFKHSASVSSKLVKTVCCVATPPILGVVL